MYAVVINGKYWCDVGTIEQYVQAHFDILEGSVQLALPGTESQPGVWLGDRVVVDQTARLMPPVVIGDGCAIGPQVDRARSGARPGCPGGQGRLRQA